MVVCCDVADSNATLCCTSSPLSWPSHGWFSWPAPSWVSCMRRRNVWKRYSSILVNNQFITHCGWLCLTHSGVCVSGNENYGYEARGKLAGVVSQHPGGHVNHERHCRCVRVCRPYLPPLPSCHHLPLPRRLLPLRHYVQVCVRQYLVLHLK